VFERFEGGADACLIRDLETGAESKLPFHIRSPRWSRDGRAILGDTAGDVVLYSIDDRTIRKVTKGGRPAWSADDSQIYFQRRGKLEDGHELWRVSRDGTNERKVLDLRPMVSIDPFYDVSPKDEVTWVQFKRGVHELWMIDLAR
jgi:Tol biopolymer transport system component